MNVWHRGHIKDIEMFWYDQPLDRPFDINDPMWSKESGVLVSRALMVWWVKITYWNGQSGWLKLINTTDAGFNLREDIDGMDSCG